MATALAPLFMRTLGLDYDDVALAHTPKRNETMVTFIRGDAMALPFGDCSLEVVICAQVYEHVPNDSILFAEIFRVLKPGGVVFFSGPNKLFPVELHYSLPLLQWLPVPLADRWLRALGRGDHYYERSRTLWSLRGLLRSFVICDVTLEVLRDMKLTQSDLASRVLRYIPGFVWRLFLPVFPNFNWLLYKPSVIKDAV
jgi:SAM-dependent methyltransferase